MTDYLEISAVEWAAGVRKGSLSAVRGLDWTLERIADHDPLLGSFINLEPELALERARRIDDDVARGVDPGPLAGVPIAIKDNMVAVDIETRCGSRILEGFRSCFASVSLSERMLALVQHVRMWNFRSV